MPATLEQPATQARSLATPLEWYALTPVAAIAPAYTAAVWKGGLGCCGGVLGPNGFVVIHFNETRCDKAIAGLERELARHGVMVNIARLKAPGPTAIAEFGKLVAAIERFANGDKETFKGIPLDYSLGTAFQQAVWRELSRIKYGEAISYGELAERIGRPGAARAVGSANGANPLAPVVPCHRVIAADGTLGGYGGGLDMKVRLLSMEGATYKV